MQKRITIFDTVRGFTMLSMAGFHACYDLAYLYGWDMPWFTETVFQDIWRASISWVFLFIAGWMCTLSRNNVSAPSSTRPQLWSYGLQLHWYQSTIR